MSEISILQCEKCKKRTQGDNHYKEGWIRVSGEISIGTGKYNKKGGHYISQWINADAHSPYYFCSWDCLMKYDDNNPKK